MIELTQLADESAPPEPEPVEPDQPWDPELALGEAFAKRERQRPETD
jgi:hypothetical protein